MKKFWHLLLVPFTIPNIAISLLLALPYGVRSWRWSDGCLELVARERNGRTRIWGRPAAQSLGCNVIWYSSEHAMNNDALRVHERCHVVQGLLCLGVPFLVGYALLFLYYWAKGGFGEWYDAYIQNPFERQAYRVQREYMHGDRPGAWGGHR